MAFRHWIDGSPNGTIEVSANESGTLRYWYEGDPAGTVFVTAAPTVSSGGTPQSEFFF